VDGESKRGMLSVTGDGECNKWMESVTRELIA
jgi:hypothetical protein